MQGEALQQIPPRWLIAAAWVGAAFSGSARAFELYDQVRAERAAGLAARAGETAIGPDPTAYPEM